MDWQEYQTDKELADTGKQEEDKDSKKDTKKVEEEVPSEEEANEVHTVADIKKGREKYYGIQ